MSGSRIPPNDQKAEEALLGAMLLSAEAIDSVVEVVHAEDFYRPVHGHVFAAAVRLWSANEPVDQVTVWDELRRTGLADTLGSPATMMDWVRDTPAISNAAKYAKIVAGFARLRRLIAVCSRGIETAYDLPADIDGTLDAFEAEIFDVVHASDSGVLRGGDLADLLPGFIESLRERCDRAAAGEIVGGLPTGLVDLDEKLGGLVAGEVYVIGALPGEGKTSLSLDIACHAASTGHPVVVFSLEMSWEQMLGRFLASRADVPGEEIRDGKITRPHWAEIERFWPKAARWPLRVLSGRSASPLDIRAQARRFRAQSRGQLGLIVVDYVQLVELAGPAENRQNEVRKISGQLKSMAMEFGVPVIANAQLNRGATISPDYRPKKSDLKDSGALEADAAGVLLLYREELHNPTTDRKGICEVIIDKNRYGKTGKVDLRYVAEWTTFRNLSSRPAPPPPQLALNVSNGNGHHEEDGPVRGLDF